MKLGEFGIEFDTEPDDDTSDEVSWQEHLFQDVRKKIEGQPTWQVEERVFLATFAFQKEVMYRDLEANHEAVAGHELVRLLALGYEHRESEPPVVPTSEDELDEKEPPEESITVLEADASQRACIALARSGASFVIDGPPGTGKSQTITNVIASLLASGKTVLFVSEKAAALEVVQNRLEFCGLDDFVLSAHSARASRREIAHSLSRQLSERPIIQRELGNEDLATLRQAREYLTERASAMHEIREPLGISLTTAIGRAAKCVDVSQAPNVGAITSELRPEEYSNVTAAAAQLGRAWGPVEHLDDFVWKGLEPDRYDQRWADATRSDIEAATNALKMLVEVVGEFSDRIDMQPPTRIHELEDLVELSQFLQDHGDMPTTWLYSPDSTTELAEDFVRTLEELKSLLAMSEGTGDLPNGVAATKLEALDAITCGPRGELFAKVFSTRVDAIALPEKVKALVDALDEIAEGTVLIEDRLGLTITDPLMSRIADICKLGELTGAENRPDVTWFAESKVKALRSTIEHFEKAQSCELEAADAANEWFKDSILSIDVIVLADQIAAASQSTLRSLRGGYRNAKRALMIHVVDGKSFDDVRSQIGLAINWWKASAAVEECIRDAGELLGEHYELSRTADLHRITSAISVAEQVLSLCGAGIDAQAISKKFSAGAIEDPQATAAAREVEKVLESLPEKATKVLDQDSDHIWYMKLASVKQEIENLKASADAVAALFRLVSAATNIDELRELLARQAQIDQIRSKIEATEDTNSQALGSLYLVEASDTKRIRQCLDAAAHVMVLATGAITERGAEALLKTLNDEDRDDLRSVLREWQGCARTISEQFDVETRPDVQEELRGSIADVEALLSALKNQIKDVREWLDFVEARAKLVELGFDGAVAVCEREKIDAGDVEKTFERAMLESWIDDVLRSEPRLNDLSRSKIQPIVKDFQNLDRKIAHYSVWQVIEECVKKRPSGAFRSGEYAVIEREGAKKTRHMPVRTLLERAGAAAQTLKPCFMMSPLTVSQFVPPSMLFDAVIFDEASQLPPADALSSIYRGKQLIVAGDQLQLPPTRFFSAGIDEEDVYVEDDPDVFESILDAAKASGGFPSNRLRWHYRSRHEDLITYSNYEIYDGELTTFPGVLQQGEDLGVEYFFVEDGCYEGGGRNPIEADRVAERVIWWADRNQSKPSDRLTVGVVAMNKAHANDIEEAIYRRRREREDLDQFFVADRLTGFFVKNLENVQGDERDVMILSVGYGPDKTGDIKMNFGPISQAMGKRRLNVAITRAKSRVEVFTSLEHSKIRVTSEETGTRHLKGYLAFAEQGPKALELQIRRGPTGTDSPFEDSVLETIRKWGYTAHTQVGSSGYRIDIGLCDPSDPDRYILGIECDGAQYHSAKTARDRDRLRQQVLEERGWQIYRIWGTDWYRYRDAAEQLLQQAIEAAVGNSSTRTSPVRSVHAASVGHEPIEAPERKVEFPAWATQYRIHTPGVPGGRTNAAPSDSSQRTRVASMIQEVIELEGPIHIELITARIRDGFGLQRTTRKLSETTFQSVSRLVRSENVIRDNDFYYAPKCQLTVVRLPLEGDGLREVTFVHLSEIKVALIEVMKEAHSIDHDELTRLCAAYFGWSRRGRGIATALDRAVEGVLEDGLALLGSDGLYRVRA